MKLNNLSPHGVVNQTADECEEIIIISSTAGTEVNNEDVEGRMPYVLWFTHSLSTVPGLVVNYGCLFYIKCMF